MAKKKKNLKPFNNHKPTIGQRAADAIAKWAGSWTFIITLSSFMVLWIIVNLGFIFLRWDPYPFILLNFVLSTFAAFQAPIILMSQNRMAERDRVTAKYDYQVNRKAEREIQNMQKDLDEIKSILKRKKSYTRITRRIQNP